MPRCCRILDVERVVIERRQRRDHAAQHRHRMRVVVEAVEEVLQRLVHHRVSADRRSNAANCGCVGSSPLISRYATSRKLDCLASCSIG